MWDPGDPTRHEFLPGGEERCWWCGRGRARHLRSPAPSPNYLSLITIDPRTGLVLRKEP